MLAELNNNLIGIIVAIIVTIVASLVKKKQPEEEWELPPELKPRRDQPPKQSQTPKVSRWEEELRRVLEQPRPLPSAPPPAPPPLIYHQPPPLARMEEYQTTSDEGAPEEPAVPRLHALTEAAQSHAHAASLWQRTQDQLHQLHGPTHRATAPASVHHVEVAPEIRELLKTLRQPHGARAAILASVILGPPRAFEI